MLLVREEASVGALERLLCRFGEDVLEVDSERFRLREVPSVEEVLERLDLEPFLDGLFERLSLSELTASPHRYRSCRHCVLGSKSQLVVLLKRDPTAGSVRAVIDGSLQEPFDSHSEHFP